MDTENFSPNQIVENIIKTYEDYLLSPEVDAQKKAFIMEKLDLMKNFNLKIAAQEELSAEDFFNAMKITCYGSLAYCCGLDKNCPWRDAARAALHMNDQLYISKESVILDLVLHTKRKFVGKLPEVKKVAEQPEQASA